MIGFQIVFSVPLLSFSSLFWFTKCLLKLSFLLTVLKVGNACNSDQWLINVRGCSAFYTSPELRLVKVSTSACICLSIKLTSFGNLKLTWSTYLLLFTPAPSFIAQSLHPLFIRTASLYISYSFYSQLSFFFLLCCLNAAAFMFSLPYQFERGKWCYFFSPYNPSHTISSAQIQGSQQINTFCEISIFCSASN